MLGASQAAKDFADGVLELVPELIAQAREERRTNACWYELVAEYSLQDCAKIMRPYWRWQRRRHHRRCAANKALANSCALARARVRMEGTA